MILTLEQFIKQYFPEAVETTRDLYEKLDLAELGYSYLDWLKDAEKYGISKFTDEVDYRLLPDEEKNYWISQAVFWNLIQSSPGKICDQIRSYLLDVSKRATTDRKFARQLQEEIDKEYGIEAVAPKASKKLKTQYNETGKDAFEFSIKADTRLHFDIISTYDFQPGQKIKDVYFFLELQVEDGVPYHIVNIMVSLTNNDALSYRTIWCCSQERLNYGSILNHRLIRVNLFEDNKKLLDSYDYILSPSDAKTLELELEKVIGMIMEVRLEEIDLVKLGEKILNRYNLNEQAYALAIKQVVKTITSAGINKDSEAIDNAFNDAVNQYWELYLLQPDPTKTAVDSLDQMIADRLPRVMLALVVSNMLDYDDLFEKYFQRRFTEKQKRALLSDGSLRLLYSLSAREFDAQADPEKRIADMSAFITEHFDLMRKILSETGQWPS